jgi:SDR family mycofactocin-dependent oxidoreductase
MASYDFTDTVALVTGAARGQGRSHALRFAEHGADVVVTDVCETPEESTYDLAGTEDLRKTAAGVEDRGGDALAVEMEVSAEADVERALDRALDEFGRVDVLANNAGVAPVSGLLDLDEATWDHALDVNLKGTWLCAKHVGAHMAERGGGRIVNTSSTAGLAASPGLGHYAAAKHGVVGLTKTLAVELAPHDVTVNAVCPTAVDTPMTGGIVESIEDDIAALAEQSAPDNLLGDIVPPEDVSNAVLWLASDDARYVTGVALPVAAGATVF